MTEDTELVGFNDFEGFDIEFGESFEYFHGLVLRAIRWGTNKVINTTLILGRVNGSIAGQFNEARVSIGGGLGINVNTDRDAFLSFLQDFTIKGHQGFPSELLGGRDFQVDTAEAPSQSGD